LGTSGEKSKQQVNTYLETNKDPLNTRKEATRVFIVLNPVAGLTDPVAAKETIRRFCAEHHWKCDLHETQKDEDLRKLVRDQVKKGVDIVVASGGDGTVSAVVSGMVKAEIPMGILPAGTGNALARDLSIPVDLDGALNLLGSEHTVQEMDILEVAGDGADKKDFFVMNVSVGISSQIMRETGRESKRRFGFLAYIYKAIGSILHSDLHHFQVKADGRSMRISASEVMIANCKFMGLQPQIDGVKIDADDSRLDVFIVRTKSLRGYLDVLTGFLLRSKSDEDSKLRYLEVRESIEIQSERPLPVQADGEVIGKTPVIVRLIPRALRIIVPVKF
jgi:YegS/Rv2252/BmrU family lipid kinase